MFPVSVSALSTKDDANAEGQEEATLATNRRPVLIKVGIAAGGVLLVALSILGVVFGMHSPQPEMPEPLPAINVVPVAEPGVLETLATSPLRGITLLFTRHTIPTVSILFLFLAIIATIIIAAVLLTKPSPAVEPEVKPGIPQSTPEPELIGMDWLFHQIKTNIVAQLLTALVAIIVIVLVVILGFVLKKTLGGKKSEIETKKETLMDIYQEIEGMILKDYEPYGPQKWIGVGNSSVVFYPVVGFVESNLTLSFNCDVANGPDSSDHNGPQSPLWSWISLYTFFIACYSQEDSFKDTPNFKANGPYIFVPEDRSNLTEDYLVEIFYKPTLLSAFPISKDMDSASKEYFTHLLTSMRNIQLNRKKEIEEGTTKESSQADNTTASGVGDQSTVGSQ